LYGAARIGDFAVNRDFRPRVSGWAVLFVGVAALTLSGCGRKGGLDLPPTAASASTANAAPPATDTETATANRASVFNPSYGTEASPTASKGSKKPFILDPLLGN
jgi:predicted small lipoprotein YifL